tara:strand:- start:3618 stop:4592 length:975 start_codon:yes stop_codon:yes gene_type:complete
MIISKTPFRIPVAGGGTDLDFYYKKRGGIFYSLAINQYVYVFLKERNLDKNYLIQTTSTQFAKQLNKIDHSLIKETLRYFKITEPVHVGVYATVPTLTGLGSSSSLVVGLINCIIKLKKLKISDKKIILTAYKIEREICGYNGGWQDQIISQSGGFVKVNISKKGKLNIKKLKENKSLKSMVNNNFMLVYTRHKRDSSKIIQSQKKNLKSVIKQYDLIKPLTDEIPKILKRKNTNLMAEVFKRHWLIKKKLSNQMSNKQINRLYDFLIRKCNFLGGKLIGAGGGGFFLMITQNKKKTIKLLKKNSINYLNFKIENKGSRVIKDV